MITEKSLIAGLPETGMNELFSSLRRGKPRLYTSFSGEYGAAQAALSDSLESKSPAASNG